MHRRRLLHRIKEDMKEVLFYMNQCIWIILLLLFCNCNGNGGREQSECECKDHHRPGRPGSGRPGPGREEPDCGCNSNAGMQCREERPVRPMPIYGPESDCGCSASEMPEAQNMQNVQNMQNMQNMPSM